MYWRLPDNWVEMTVRFLCLEYGVREIKNQMSREIIAGLDKAGIEIASGAYAIVQMPALKVQLEGGALAKSGVAALS